MQRVQWVQQVQEVQRGVRAVEALDHHQTQLPPDPVHPQQEEQRRYQQEVLAELVPAQRGQDESGEYRGRRVHQTQLCC